MNKMYWHGAISQENVWDMERHAWNEVKLATLEQCAEAGRTTAMN